MLNIIQKKLALSFLLLNYSDRNCVLEALSEQNKSALDKALTELEEIGINSSSIEFIKDQIRTDTFAQANERAANNLLKISEKISDFAQRKGHVPPKKLVEYIHMAHVTKA
jgi:hypothetical protein